MTHSPAREAVKAAFLRLLEERPLREITVKDIVQSCVSLGFTTTVWVRVLGSMR